jgi:tetratricopeptide (TPR) repeat protein
MPSKAIDPSPAVARLLRERRESLRLTLRGVAALSADAGNHIPHSTLARIERGKLDPGVRRLQQLLRLYQLPAQAAGDLLDLEALAGAVPFERDPLKLRDLALAAWRDGRVPDALACFLAFRDRVSKTSSTRAIRQEAVLSFAFAAASLGKHHLSRQLLDDLLVDKPEPSLLVSILVQQSVVWRALGSTEAAIAFLDRASTHVIPGSHRHAGWIEHQRALVEMDLTDFQSAATHLDAAIRAYRRARSPRDEAIVLISFCRLAFERGDATEAVAASKRAVAFAKRHRFARLRLFALIEQARALQLAGDPTKSRQVLRSILADSLVASDNVIRFYAHYYLWKADRAGGDPARADIELREAAYFVRFVDQTSQEVSEVRKHLAPTARKLGGKP